MRRWCVVALAAAAVVGTAARQSESPPTTLPPSAAAMLIASLEAAASHARHIWRDTPPSNTDGTINAYIEIPRGERRKFEFDIRRNARAIDRVIPESIGGYPVNYGFVPRTISYDGDPFDALVLGPPLPGGSLVRGIVIGVMFMEDEKGLDSKVVLSTAGADGEPLHELTPDVQDTIGDFFRRYKQFEPGGFSRVPGWGGATEGLAYVTTTHAFFLSCRLRSAAPCRIDTDTR